MARVLFFDYIIHDSMFGCGRMLAQILKLPAINSCTSFAQTKESFNHIMEQFPINVPKDIVKPINDKFQNLTAMVKEKYGVEIHSPYEVFCNPAPLTIVYTTREFQPYGEAFDQTYKFVGPSISSRLTQKASILLQSRKKNQFTSHWVQSNRAIDFYKLCIEAFGNTDHTIVMSIGNRTQVSDLGEVPENFIVKNDVPQTDILQHTKLFITHGGMNSTHEGLYYGLPLIIIPQSADQPIIAGQVANMGAGIKLQMESLTANQLREAADHVLSLPFKKAVAHIRESFQKTGGYHQAVNEIFAFKGQYHI
ncbi:glycosyltransferase, MGT family [Paenibacillus polymyxa]|nr:nucleotide disphospho-sugar-binding domain-containing protein [Paenibacillus polymyxa]SEJ94747.1 glycosyltransferase, MGT family [Paenibacillus polymyxa]